MTEWGTFLYPTVLSKMLLIEKIADKIINDHESEK